MVRNQFFSACNISQNYQIVYSVGGGINSDEALIQTQAFLRKITIFYYLYSVVFSSRQLDNRVCTIVRNLKFTTYLKFATCGNTNIINELRGNLMNVQ